MSDSINYNGKDILFENLTEEERKKLLNARAEAQYLYEKTCADIQKIEREKEERFQQFLAPVREIAERPFRQILEKVTLIPADKKISLRTLASVFGAFAMELGNFSREDTSKEFSNVCTNLAQVHKVFILTDGKPKPRTARDWNLLFENLKTLSNSCNDFTNSDIQNPDADEKKETVSTLGTFAENRRESLMLEMEQENREFMARMTLLKENINEFVILKTKFNELSSAPVINADKIPQSAKPEFFGNSLKKAVKLNDFFKENKNDDMVGRTGELISGIVDFLDKNPEIKKHCGVSPDELKKISSSTEKQKESPEARPITKI